MPNNFIAFNLEGVLSPQDCNEGLLKLFPGGDKVWVGLSRYAELPNPAGPAGSPERGLLPLSLPFLLLHNIQEAQIVDLAAGAAFTPGSAGLISHLEYNGWKILCLTGSPEPYALHITGKLGIYAHHVACTTLPLNDIYPVLDISQLNLIYQVEKDILALTPGTDDARLQTRLDIFFNQQLPPTVLAASLNRIEPVAGRRKLEALHKFAARFAQPLSGWAFVGCSREDSPALQAVESARGLAIAFNADQEALAPATLALASADVGDLLEVLLAWQKGGRNSVEKLVKAREKAGGRGERGYFNWISGRPDLAGVAEVHQRLRSRMKEESR